MKTSISIIIPAWNEEKLIPKISNSLRKLILPFKLSEIIFVAGGEDKTFKLCKIQKFPNFSNIIVLKQNKSDFKSGALIKGINASKGEYITLIDADTLVSSNLMIKIAKSLKKFDVVNCNYFPLINKGFWYDYYIINKLIWSKNPANLPSLFGASTITLKRRVLENIGIDNLFTNKSTAGVDYYMGMVLKKNQINIGFIKDARVFTPRPACLIDFIRDYSRWFTAFFQIHQNGRKIIFLTIISSILSITFPFILFLINFNKINKIKTGIKKKIRFFFILFVSEYILSILRINAIIRKFRREPKFLGHFKGIRYH